MRGAIASRVGHARWTLLSLLPLLLGGCEPCSGVGACGSTRVRFEGQVNRAFGFPAGAPAADVRVSFTRTSGTALVDDSIVTRSDAEGRFLLTGQVREDGEVAGVLKFTPPGMTQTVVVPGVRMTTTRAPGEKRLLGEWKVPYPYLPYSLQLYYRGTGKPAVGLEAVFRRTGGIAATPDTFRVVSTSEGIINLHPNVATTGEITGEVTVYPLPPHQPFTIRELKLQTVQTERFDSVMRVGIGIPFRLPYWFIVKRGDTGDPLPGTVVVLTRRGGIRISPEVVTGRAGAFGDVYFDVIPLEEGVLEAEFRIQPPAPALPRTLNWSLATIPETGPSQHFLGFQHLDVAPSPAGVPSPARTGRRALR